MGNVQVTSLDGCQLATSEGGKWDTKLYVPSIITLKEDGVVEVGQYIDMHNNADYDKDNTWRITANTNSLDFKSKTGSLLSFGSNGNIQCATIYNVDTTKISLNDHNHDEIYAKKDHEHTNYASTEHTHSYNDLNDKPETFPPTVHTHSYNDLNDKPETFPPSEHTHSYNDLSDKPETFPPSVHTHTEYALKDHNHDTKYAATNHTHSYNELTDIPTVSNPENITCSTINGFALNSSPSYSNVDISVPSIAVIKNDGVLETGPYIDMHSKDGLGGDYAWRIQCTTTELTFISKEGNEYYITDNGGQEQINTTITHNAPVEEDLTQFQIGSPVFLTGNVYALTTILNSIVGKVTGKIDDHLLSIFKE
ncbi:minor tail protein [Histomonas meleagridis]|nr:minor tail protein [Histomonas meleagridis]